MALLVDIAAVDNATGVDIKDVYLRITSALYYPLHRVFKIVVYGFINGESGKLHRVREQAEAIEFKDALKITKKGYIAGDANFTLPPDFSPALGVLREFKDPWSLFSEIYNIEIPEGIGITNSELWAYAYNVIKQDPRYKNIRDEVD